MRLSFKVSYVELDFSRPPPIAPHCRCRIVALSVNTYKKVRHDAQQHWPGQLAPLVECSSLCPELGFRTADTLSLEYSVPHRPNRCHPNRTAGTATEDPAARLLSHAPCSPQLHPLLAFLSLWPRWLEHMVTRHSVLDGDSIFLHMQARLGLGAQPGQARPVGREIGSEGDVSEAGGPGDGERGSSKHSAPHHMQEHKVAEEEERQEQRLLTKQLASEKAGALAAPGGCATGTGASPSGPAWKT